MLQVHPAADLFPTMSGAELVELGEDIKRRTLQQPVTLLMPKDGGEPVLLDGRNRLAAMGAVGMLVIGAGRKLAVRHEIIDETADFDPVAFVISANIHRGHLTAEEKRALIANLLIATPERSDSATAKLAKADDKTVTKIRRRLEATSGIPKLHKTLGADGKARSRPRQVHTKRLGATKPSQGRDQAIFAFSTTLRTDLARTLDDLVRLLRDQRPRITEITIEKRVAIARGYLDALGVQISDLTPAGTSA